MTEEEAKTKWCPHVRHSYTLMAFETNPTAVSINRCLEKDQQSQGCNCIGSACMAWRWRLRPEAVHYWNEANSKTNGEAYPGGPFAENGYCGLAGKP